jgi:hypothetical protein
MVSDIGQEGGLTDNSRSGRLRGPAVSADSSSVLNFSLLIKDSNGEQNYSEVTVTVNSLTNKPADLPGSAYPLTTSTGKIVGLAVDSGNNIVAMSGIDPATIADSTGKPDNLPMACSISRSKLQRWRTPPRYYLLTGGPGPDTFKYFKYHDDQGWLISVLRAFNPITKP